MPGHFVFVRFFRGCPESFPFDRFLLLEDGAMGGALDAWHQREQAKPANRKRSQAVRDELAKRQKEWLEAGVARPTSDEQTRAAQPRPEAEQEGHGIVVTLRYPIARFANKEDADAATAALQARVGELARAAYEKTWWSDEDDLHATANPRFFVVVEADLSRAEVVIAQEQIKRLGVPAEGPVAREEALVRFFLLQIRPTLDQARGLTAAGARESRSDPVPESQRATNSTPGPQPTHGTASATMPSALGCIVALGDLCYQIGTHRPVVVSESMDNVLQAFLAQPAMNEGQLVKKSGQDDAVKILRTLRNWMDGMFAPAIHFPPGKAQGGYHVNIRRP